MSASIYFDVPYHQQDADNYCGLAAAQMVLASTGAPPLDQSSLVNGALVMPGGISPSTLAGVLNHWASTIGLAATFSSPAPYADYDKALRAVVDNLIRTGIAVPVLAFGSARHWLVVKGAVLDGPIVAGGAYAVRGLIVANPAPVTAAVSATDAVDLATIHATYGDQPVPHVAGDACGKGDVTGAKDVYITAAAWREYNWPSTPDGQPSTYVVVANARTTPVALPSSAVKQFRSSDAGAALAAAAPATAVMAAAQAGVRAHGLDQCPPFASAFAGTHPSQPVMQEVGTTTVRQWQYVQFLRPSAVAGQPDQVTAAVFVDADGTFLGALAPPSHFVDPLDFVALARQALIARQASFADLLGPEPIAQDEIAMVTPRFWQASAESLSPDRAFMRVRVRGHELIVGDDGRVYRQLTPPRCNIVALPSNGKAKPAAPEVEKT
ncbi:MAG TPA: papain-like cysteine protease family protein [Candidatus Sulfotelmatobacter sp.]|nr:papain-like cysteine protease family protein [Candidatus Sulfotelmatobacter sp.]